MLALGSKRDLISVKFLGLNMIVFFTWLTSQIIKKKAFYEYVIWVLLSIWYLNDKRITKSFASLKGTKLSWPVHHEWCNLFKITQIYDLPLAEMTPSTCNCSMCHAYWTGHNRSITMRTKCWLLYILSILTCDSKTLWNPLDRTFWFLSNIVHTNILLIMIQFLTCFDVLHRVP